MSWSGHCEVIGPRTQQQPRQKSLLYEVMLVMTREVHSSAEKVIACAGAWGDFLRTTGVYPCCRVRCRTLYRRQPDDFLLLLPPPPPVVFSLRYLACAIASVDGFTISYAYTYPLVAALARAMRVYDEDYGDIVVEHAGWTGFWTGFLFYFYVLHLLVLKSV